MTALANMLTAKISIMVTATLFVSPLFIDKNFTCNTAC